MQKAPNSTGNISLQAGGGVGGVGGGSVNNSGSDNNTAGSHQMKPLRSESFAYPRSPHQDLLSRMKFYARQHAQPVVATLAFVVFVLFVSSDYVHTNGLRGSVKGATFGGAYYPGYFHVEDSVVTDTTFKFAAVTDLDELSRIKEAKKPEWQSFMLTGTITRSSTNNHYTMNMDTTMRTLRTKHNEAGRGAEFSELTVFDDRLLTFDDRTGDVFEILNTPDGTDSFVAPRFVITEGSGDTDKGMKWEWATVKDGILYMGSMGKEYTRPDGSIANTNNLWIATLSPDGMLSRFDWSPVYDTVRAALGATSPGYVIHESVNWSPHLRKWVFLPRRVSSEPYDENKDERNGATKLVLVSEDFSSTQVVDIKIKEKDGLHGFSSFAFIPKTGDKHALALRSVEEDCVGGDDQICKQRSYIMIFDVLTGEVLMDEVKINADMKFEGIEMVDMFVRPPPSR